MDGKNRRQRFAATIAQISLLTDWRAPTDVCKLVSQHELKKLFANSNKNCEFQARNAKKRERAIELSEEDWSKFEHKYATV